MDGNQPGVQLIESEEDKKKKGQATQPGSAFSPTGQPASPAPSGTQQARAAQTAGPTRGTGFTGVGRFLQANVGSRLGQEVAGRVSQAGQQATSRLGQAVGQFGQQLGSQQRQLAQQQQAAQSALQRIAGSSSQPAQLEPTSLTPSQEEVAAYQAITGGQVQAPTGLQDVEDVRAQAALAGQLAKGTQTATGRSGLLRQFAGRGPRQYTAGQSALDALILGQSGGQLAAARRASAGLGRQVETQSRLAEEQARQFGAEAQRVKAGITGERQTLLNDLLEAGRQQKETYEREQGDFLRRAKDEIESGKPISTEVADALFGEGVSRISTMGFSPQELSNLIKQSDLPTLETSLTSKQAAQIEALKRLGSEQSLYKSPEEQARLAGTTTEGGGRVGRGIKFDESGKYRAKKEAFGAQKNIIDKTLKELEKEDPKLAQEFGDIIYGRGVAGRFAGRSPEQLGLTGEDDLSVLEKGRLIKDFYTGRGIFDARAQFYNGNRREFTNRLKDALLEIEKLGLSGQTLQTVPSLRNK